MRRIHADLMLLLAAAVWGVAFVFQKSAMDHIGPNTFIAARGFLAALTLLPFAIHEASRVSQQPPIKLLQIAGIAGIAFFLGALFQQLGLQTATVSNTGFLTGLYVIITPFIAWGWIGQRPTPVVWAAVALSFVGTWLLGGGTLDGFNRGDGFVAICAIYWAVHITIVGYSSRFNRPVLFTTIQFAVVGLLGLLASLVTETTTMSGLRAAIPSIAFVGVLSSALTFTLLAMAMKHTTTAEATIIVSLETVIAAIAGALMLGERLSWSAMAGATLILAAIIVVQLAAQTATPQGEAAPKS
jgi:drug/metabolite transporter (DMT)-like permease